MFCPHCAAPIRESDRFCPQCGGRTQELTVTPPAAETSVVLLPSETQDVPLTARPMRSAPVPRPQSLSPRRLRLSSQICRS